MRCRRFTSSPVPMPAVPILYGDRLVEKLDATADRKAGMLRVDAVHEDGLWGKPERAAVHDEICRRRTSARPRRVRRDLAALL